MPTKALLAIGCAVLGSMLAKDGGGVLAGVVLFLWATVVGYLISTLDNPKT